MSNKDSHKIFTVQEEGDANMEISNQPQTNYKFFNKENNQFRFNKSKPKIENKVLKERSKSFVGGLNMKVCSTPTVEKTLIHDDLVSICNNSINESKSTIPQSLMPEIVQNAISSKFRNRILSSKKYFHNQFFRISMDDLMMDFTNKRYPTPLKYFNFGLPKSYREVGMETDERKSRCKIRKKNFYKTIADPKNPVFRYDGVSLSKSLYNTYLDEHYKDYAVANITIDSREEFLKSKQRLEYENKKPKTDLVSKTNGNILENRLNDNELKINNKENHAKIPTASKNELTKVNQKAFRRSLSLPLKPLSYGATENMSPNTGSSKNKVLFNRTPTTPLTTKLGLLTFGDQPLGK